MACPTVVLLVLVVLAAPIDGLSRRRHHLHRFEELHHHHREEQLAELQAQQDVAQLTHSFATGSEINVTEIINADSNAYFPDMLDDLQEQYDLLKSSGSADLNTVPDINGDGVRDFNEFLTYMTDKLFPGQASSQSLLETGAISWCMRRWCDRGAGTVPNTCDWGSPFTPAKTEQNGLLCYQPCNPNHIRWGFRCYHDCSQDPALFNFAGYQPWGLGLCHGPGGAFDFKLRPSYSQLGEVFGCGLTQEAGHPLKMDYEAGLCYKQCPQAAAGAPADQGFSTQVTMCRQNCPAGQIQCGMFCFSGGPGDNVQAACTARMLMISAKIVAAVLAGGAGIVAVVTTGGVLAPVAAVIAAALAGSTVPHEFLQVGWCGALAAPAGGAAVSQSLVNEVVGGAAGGPVTQYAVPLNFADNWKCQY